VARILDHSPLARRAGAVRGRSRAGYSLAPMENLEHVDAALIDRAEHEIDLAAYVLTDWPIMQALTCAADHGVQIHTYLYGTQLAVRELKKVFHDFTGVELLARSSRTYAFSRGLTLVSHTSAQQPDQRISKDYARSH